MILFTPLWNTMQIKGITTYTLREKYGVSGSTVQRLKKNQPINTTTLNNLCRLLECSLSEIAEYIED